MNFHDFWYSRFPAKHVNLTLDEYYEWLNREGRFTSAVADAVNFASTKISLGKTVFYIAGALTEASEDDKERYARVSEIVSTRYKRARGLSAQFFGYAPHLYGTDPKKHPYVTPQEVRDIDYLWAVVMAEAHINLLVPVAHGNAIEEGWAEASHIPTIMCAPKDARISRLMRGMINIDTMIWYQDIEEVYRGIARIVNELHEWMDKHPGRQSVGFFAERAYLKEMEEKGME